MSGNHNKNIIVIGICGVTCGGKTTLAQQLNRLLPSSRIISQDDYFLNVDDPRHTWIPELNHINFELLSSLDMEKMVNEVKEVLANPSFLKNNYTNGVGDTAAIGRKILEKQLQIIIIEGFSIFNYKPLVSLFHLKYYLSLSRDECYRRRIKRVYEPPDCPGYFEQCAWPEHLKQLKEVKETVPDVRYFDEFSENPLNVILQDLEKFVDKL